MTSEEMEKYDIQIAYSIDMKEIILTISVPDHEEPISPEQYREILQFFAEKADMKELFSDETSAPDGTILAH